MNNTNKIKLGNYIYAVRYLAVEDAYNSVNFFVKGSVKGYIWRSAKAFVNGSIRDPIWSVIRNSFIKERI